MTNAFTRGLRRYPRTAAGILTRWSAHRRRSPRREKRTLTLADERYLRQESFEWGYDGGGPALLSQAILNDYLGIEVDLLVARTFMREVISHLPSEFELDGRDVAQWLSEPVASSLRDEARASL